MNLTLFEPTKECFEWCRNAQLIHQSNIELSLLSIPIIALISLSVPYFIANYRDIILDRLKMYEETLDKISEFLYFFGLTLIFLFLIYMLWFR